MILVDTSVWVEHLRHGLPRLATLLQLLLQANAVVEREVLLAAVWGENFYGDPNVLDVYIRYLRQKLEWPGMPTLIQTVRGVGYMLKPAAPKT